MVGVNEVAGLVGVAGPVGSVGVNKVAGPVEMAQGAGEAKVGELELAQVVDQEI